MVVMVFAAICTMVGISNSETIASEKLACASARAWTHVKRLF